MALTTGEKSALRWLAAVTVLGSGVQLYRNWRNSGDATPIAAEALSRQLVAVDSAQRAGRRGRGARGGGVGAARRPVSVGRRRLVAPDSAVGAREQVPTLQAVDVDASDSAQLERLPKIGPALAARIVADRRAKGPFGSLAGLQRVRGIGPKLAALLGPYVTFSGTPRPSTVQR